MTDERTLVAIDTIDRLINLDFLLRGTVITEFYKAARTIYGEPLIYAGARRLVEHVRRGDAVVITTGNVVGPSYMAECETDGPGGSAILARAIALGLEAVPILAVDQRAGPGVEGVMRAAGFVPTTLQNLQRFKGDLATWPRKLLATSVVELPPNDEGSQRRVDQVMDLFHPRAIIALEKGSPNASGVYHNSMGMDTSMIKGRGDYFFRSAEADAVLTIGIGDGGNEIGYGVIRDVVRKFKQFGDVCRCPCGGGIAAITGADVLITADVSNWGGYALAAALLSLVGKADQIHDDAMEVRVLEATARAGFIHMGSEVAPSVDTFPLSTNVRVAGLIRDIAHQVQRFNFQEFVKAFGDKSDDVSLPANRETHAP